MYEKLSNAKRFIEDLSLRNSNYGNLYTEEGSGREVILYGDYAIKMPLGHYNIVTNGCNQNLKELEVWLSTKHPYLVPIYSIHMGCLISKKVEADLDYVSEKYNLTREEIDNKIKQRLPEVIAIAKEFDHLNMSAQAPLFICGDSTPFCFGRETKSLKRIFIVTF